MKRTLRTLALLGASLLAAAGTCAQRALPERPNIVMIMGDDIGYWNVGLYSHGMMVPTPHIDRIGREGMLFTDHYAEPSCTAGRAAFLTGQMPIRTGLTTVGLPGSPIGHDKRDPSLAEILKARGYRTGHFGKSHLGDRDEHLPHQHGFDEFFGNLYHLNSEEEPEQRDYPTARLARFKPRGVIEAFAGQTPRDMGPLTVKRMETFDEEILERSLNFVERSAKAKQPFFLWHNPTRMHVYTHLKPESRHLATPISSEDDIHGSGMMELDGHVGQLLKKLDDLGLAKNTIVIFTSDNGAQTFNYPDNGTTPFRGEKSSTWEGGYRVPMLVRWPEAVKPGSVSNGIQTHYDLFTTLSHAAGLPGVADQLKASHKVRIDGVDNLAHWLGNAPSSRDHFIYYNEREMVGLRWGPWKGLFKEREGFFDPLKQSYMFRNLRMDPFEKNATDRDANRLALRKAWIGGVFQDVLGQHVMSLREFPPRQVGGSLRPDERLNTTLGPAAPAPSK
jgi:arylsulfatase A-like enzyme